MIDSVSSLPDAGRGLVAPARRYYGWVIARRRRARDGRHAARAHAGPRSDHRAAPCRSIASTASQYAQINLVATLVGALFAFGMGSLIDRRGSRLVVTAIAAALGLVVIAMSRSTTVTALLIVLITLTRGLGQSALSIVSLAMVGKWFRRRLTWAMGVYALVMSVGFMLAFPAVGALVLASGWRSRGRRWAWALVGLAPVPGSFARSTPESDRVGRWTAMRRAQAPHAASPMQRWPAALRSPAFWVFGAGEFALRARRLRHRALQRIDPR